MQASLNLKVKKALSKNIAGFSTAPTFQNCLFVLFFKNTKNNYFSCGFFNHSRTNHPNDCI